MSTLKAFIAMGIIPKGTLLEAHRWGIPLPVSPEVLETYEQKSPDIEQAAALSDAALNERDGTFARETDLDMARQFASTRVATTIHLEDAESASTVEVDVGRSVRGEYILHWSCEGLESLLTNGRTYLEFGPRRIYITQVRLFTYGENDYYTLAVGEERNVG
jgi:hypothetical protein